MNDVILIKWDTLDAINRSGSRGQMQVILNAFFPATVSDIKKLFKVIHKDFECARAEQNIEQVLNYLNNAVPESKSKAKEYADTYVHRKTELAELSQQVKNKKAASGLPVTGEELKKMRNHKKELSGQCTALKSAFTAENNRLKKLQANLLTVQQLNESRW